MLELIAGVLVVLAALALVLEPLIFGKPNRIAASQDELEVVELEESESPRIQSLLALREIDFDHATGKLSDDDYARLKASYTERALAAIKSEKASDQVGTSADDASSAEDEAERLIRAAKGQGDSVCPVCGPRPEVGAVFCSTCGRGLSVPSALPRCPKCGTEVQEGSKFCAGCGEAVGKLELEALHLS